MVFWVVGDPELHINNHDANDDCLVQQVALGMAGNGCQHHVLLPLQIRDERSRKGALSDQWEEEKLAKVHEASDCAACMGMKTIRCPSPA